MASRPAKTSKSLSARPALDALLVHPIRKKDNGPEDDGGDSYADWILDHTGKAHFYVVGFEWLRSVTRRGEANYYHTFGEEAFAVTTTLEWSDEIETDFRGRISYNQFRNALILHRPMFFGHAAQVLVSCELALGDAIKKGRYSGDATEVYKHMNILPACYNIDGFKPDTLASMRGSIEDFDRKLLTASNQNSRQLLERLTDGHCVTRRTARAIRSKMLELSERIGGQPSFVIGDVRGRPGRRLGRKSATMEESIQFDDLGIYRDRPSGK